MNLALYGFIITSHWIHKTNLCDRYGNTVAMIYAYRKMCPPQIWKHNPRLMNKKFETVAMILAK